MAAKAQILVVDDKASMLDLFRNILGDRYDLVTADQAPDALRLAMEGDFDVVVTDIKMPRMSGLEILREIKAHRPDVEVIMMTAFAEVKDAVEAMKTGAFDYIVKPFDPDEAVVVIEKALEVNRLRALTRRLRSELDQARGFGDLVGTSPVMQRVYTLIDRAAATGVNVLITGETGTGKELVARAIHDRGARKDGPFMPINCGALPASLAESELFGHAKGSFTGAFSNKPGLFEEAGGGTLFLDEINSLPLGLQVKLNRAIEEREGRRVGSNRTYKIDVRLLATTNKDLQEEVREGRFREDLYFRLHVLPIALPALRERAEDVALLAGHFLAASQIEHSVQGFKPTAIKAMLAYDWPGNVRELQNVIEAALVVASGSQIAPADLPPKIAGLPGRIGPVAKHMASLTYREARELGRDRQLKQYFTDLMEAHHGNVTAAAAQADVERETLHRLLKKYTIDLTPFRKSS